MIVWYIMIEDSWPTIMIEDSWPVDSWPTESTGVQTFSNEPQNIFVEAFKKLVFYIRRMPLTKMERKNVYFLVGAAVLAVGFGTAFGYFLSRMLDKPKEKNEERT